MKKFIPALLLLLLCTPSYGQDAEAYYYQAIEKAQAGELEAAIGLFDKSIAQNNEEYIAWFNRGIAKSLLRNHEEAVPDFNQTLKLYPEFKEAYLYRGFSRQNLTDYEGAITDYARAIELDPEYAMAYYNRGLVLEMLGKNDSACNDFHKAEELGMKKAGRKVKQCENPSDTGMEIHPILRLTETAEDDAYGFTSENPVLVGTGPNGGPANQRAYLDLLRDQQGKPLSYRRVGSCCDYESENGLFGYAKLDQYEITYLDKNGEEHKAIVYISFYDYEAPRILHGFQTIEAP